MRTGSPDEAQALHFASEVAAGTEGEGAVELGIDVRWRRLRRTDRSRRSGRVTDVGRG
ncbi:hypothetical protein ACFZDP_49505 [Streptomyces mirabilis]|uniref:hypothetical protein n=1 Tax=Streptomyces mirabilis TaxID=68239 RepID=UPI0036E24879